MLRVGDRTRADQEIGERLWWRNRRHREFSSQIVERKCNLVTKARGVTGTQVNVLSE